MLAFSPKQWNKQKKTQTEWEGQKCQKYVETDGGGNKQTAMGWLSETREKEINWETDNDTGIWFLFR